MIVIDFILPKSETTKLDVELLLEPCFFIPNLLTAQRMFKGKRDVKKHNNKHTHFLCLFLLNIVVCNGLFLRLVHR